MTIDFIIEKFHLFVIFIIIDLFGSGELADGLRVDRFEKANLGAVCQKIADQLILTLVRLFAEVDRLKILEKVLKKI